MREVPPSKLRIRLPPTPHRSLAPHRVEGVPEGDAMRLCGFPLHLDQTNDDGLAAKLAALSLLGSVERAHDEDGCVGRGLLHFRHGSIERGSVGLALEVVVLA